MNSNYFKRLVNTSQEQTTNPEATPKSKAKLHKAAAEKVSLYERLS